VVKTKSKQLQKLAKESTRGMIDALEARQRVRQIESSLKVYDGANLEHAVKVLLRHLEGK
jgi:ribosomal protein L13